MIIYLIGAGSGASLALIVCSILILTGSEYMKVAKFWMACFWVSVYILLLALCATLYVLANTYDVQIVREAASTGVLITTHPLG